MDTKKLGFTLIELLVVVAIIGILSAVGIVAYNGYITGAEKKTSESIVLQISLAQQEYYSENGTYYATTSGSSCSPSTSTSALIDTNLLNSSLLNDTEYLNVCSFASGDTFGVVGLTDKGCQITANSNASISRNGC